MYHVSYFKIKSIKKRVNVNVIKDAQMKNPINGMTKKTCVLILYTK